MKQELMDAIQETPVIAAVKDDAGLCNALTNKNIRVVFVLYGDICNISSIVRRIHEAGRFAVVHVGRRHHLHPAVLHPPRQGAWSGRHPAGIPAGFHRTGKSGQDPRKPTGLSGPAARCYA